MLTEVARVLRGYDLDRQSRYALLERLVRTRGGVVDDIDANQTGEALTQHPGHSATHLSGLRLIKRFKTKKNG